MFRFTSFALVLTLIGNSFAFPNDIVKCKINDEECLVKSANEVLRQHFRGFDEINIPPIDPLFVPYAKVFQRSGPVTIDSISTNSSIKGFSKGIIEKFRGFERNLMEIKIKVPKLEFRGTYKAKAYVLGIPVNGGGPYKNIFEKFDAGIIFNLTRVERDGKDFFKVVSTWMSFNVEDGEVDIPDIGFLLNAFLNASFNLIKNALTPVISETWAEIFKEQFGKIFDTVPINELFLESES